MRRIGIPFEPTELDRIRQAARRRRLSLGEYVRQSAIATSDEDLGQRRFEIDPWARHPAEGAAVRKEATPASLLRLYPRTRA